MLQGLTDEEEEEMDSVLSTENKVGFDSGSTACVALVNKVRYAINPWLLLLVVFLSNKSTVAKYQYVVSGALMTNELMLHNTT